MEEKERYELKIYAGCEYYSITDTKEKQQITIENTINLLNQQDKRIKELEEENKMANINNYLADYWLAETENKQLKQQLEEIEKIEYTDTINFVETSEPDIVAKELDRLNEQLAEKDKDIKYFKESYYMIQDEKDHYAGQCLNLQDRIEELEKIINESFHNQDKISFAVEQLEVARRRIDRLGYNENKCLNKKDCIEDCLEEIDNQIKELKGEK